MFYFFSVEVKYLNLWVIWQKALNHSRDLPKFIKQVGSFTKYIKKMSSEFKSSINEIAEEEEIKELAKSVKEVKKIKDGINIKKNFENEIKEVQETVKMTEDEFSNKK